MLTTKFHTHTKQRAKLYFSISTSIYFWIANCKILPRMIACIPWLQSALNFFLTRILVW
jgi:hypothetical protein